MQKTDIRHIFHLSGKKVVLLLLLALFFLPQVGKAQLNYMEYANKKIYFGIALGVNISKFRPSFTQEFARTDTINVIETSYGPGFNLGVVTNFKLGKYFDIRAIIPTLVFADKSITFQEGDGTFTTRKIESIYLDFPVGIRFKSQPIKDMRFYVMMGLKYSFDLASNAKARRANDQIKIRKHDLSYEFALGLQFFFPLFIFSPEIKFSAGTFNVHEPNEDLIYSRQLEKLRNRSITISVFFEG